MPPLPVGLNPSTSRGSRLYSSPSHGSSQPSPPTPLFNVTSPEWSGMADRSPIHHRYERPRQRRHNEGVHLTVLDGLPVDHEAAVRVWNAANVARLLAPGGDRVARIWEKIAEPEACLVIGHLDADRDVVAMALAEPGRAEHGAGAVIPGYGHVSMVFVHPDMWGRGIGHQLLQGLHERASARGWSRTTLWTRASNARAQRLYEGLGYRRSGQETTLGSGDPILQLERQASRPAAFGLPARLTRPGRSHPRGMPSLLSAAPVGSASW